MLAHRRIMLLTITLSTSGIGMAHERLGAAEADRPLSFAIAVHGGAGPWANRSPEDTAAIRKTLKEALQRGRDVLAGGGASLDAVEQTIRYLEDSPLFNAGKGATFTATGQHQLDASIMRGEDLAAGAVASVAVVKNPISLARRVMTDTKHVLLAGDGADEFARQIGAELVRPDYFWTEKTRAEWNAAQASADQKKVSGMRSPMPPNVAASLRDAAASFGETRLRENDHYGTVGCVALDQQGNLAAGTSTGGLKMKQFGRVGDSPIIGAGTYADNQSCAVSCTGVGELFIRNAVAYDIAARMQYQGATLKDAAQIQVEKRLPAETAGLIALSPAGEIIAAFNTAAMPRGMADSSGRFEIHIERE
jgi:beta-aspartyl-peptidase (threonine type)